MSHKHHLLFAIACLLTIRSARAADPITIDHRPGPGLLSIPCPEGNYLVTLTLGDPAHASDTTVKAELRRLVLESIKTEPGPSTTRTFSVSIRTPSIPGGGEVRLKDREMQTEMVNWDNQLTLEFLGPRAAVTRIEITRADPLPTLFILGDSTVADQPTEPWNSWGQMLPRFFKPTIVIANHAQSGESLKSSLSARRLEKVLSSMKSGDYLLLQYGHNDMKERGEGIGPFTSYKSDLKRFADAANARGATPILVTSMHRKSLDADGRITNTLGDYPEAVCQLAKEMNLPLIDLHSMSATLYQSLGRANIDKAFQDGSHHNTYGSYQLAKAVAQGIRDQAPLLASHLSDDFKPYDPANPDDPATFSIRASADGSTAKPDGN